jgi:excisionase family DNA binding protein
MSTIMGGMGAEAARIPSRTVAEEAREALHALTRFIPRKGSGHVRLRLEDASADATISVPGEALALFLEVLGQMANGNAVTIVPVHAELTTHQAAEILNVSRPYFIGLLEAGEIPYRMVGTHRRVRFVDLMAYRRKDDVRRDKALAELTQQAEDLDLGY